MSLDDLVEWVDAAMARLPSGREIRNRVKHVRQLYRILDKEGPRWKFREPWYALASKIARLLNETAPEKPMKTSAGQRTRTPWRSPEPPPPRKPRRVEKPFPDRRDDERPARRRLAKPKPQPIEINAQLQAAFDAVAAGRQIIFVTGGAGTGKSTFIRELRARFSEKQSVVLAPTGVAALNAGGQTIHSFCRLPSAAGDAAGHSRDRRERSRSGSSICSSSRDLDGRARMFSTVSMPSCASTAIGAPFRRRAGGSRGRSLSIAAGGDARDAPRDRATYSSPHFFSARSLKD